MHRPKLVRHARYRRDNVRGQHQLVFPEGILILNDSAAAVVQLCDGRRVEELLADLSQQFGAGFAPDEALELLERLAKKGLVRDALD